MVLNRMKEPGFDLAITAALEVGDLVYATKLLDLIADAHVGRLDRALNAAIIHDYDDVAWRLLAIGANVTIPPSYGLSPLYTAAKRRKLNLVRTMLECNLSPLLLPVGIHDEGQSTSLVEALVDMGDHKIVTDLLQLYGCESKTFHRGFITSVPPTPSNPLERALEKADQDTFWAIIKLSSQRTRRDSLSCALKIAVRREDPSLLYSLFGFGANPDDEDALSLAVMEHPSMVEPLLKRFREVYPNGRSGYGVTAMSRVLSQHPILSEGLSALINSKLVDEKELSYENIHGHSLLSLAFEGRIDERGIRHVDIDLIKMLLDAGSNPNSVSTRVLRKPWITVRDWTTTSVLLDAISTRNIKLVSLLIERGARVNEPTRLGMRRTPLQKAAEVGSLEIIRLLLEKGADINAAAAGRHGGTALQFAAIVGDCTMATELIEHGARFDVRPSWGNEGRWPLEGAAENGRIDMIQLLWYANSGNFDEKQCQKAMKLAERNGHIGCRDKIAELMSTSWVPAIEHPTESQGGPLDIVWGEGGLSMFG
ncbi:ankyrin [Hypoxylon rubiginosum]|uniref:Ankyrin n=1 Tax=Hypoxylon rubiginosum TaxID=110542 RepID=A0ACC0CT42_9PEZI|nr:ankyrin [Hypoxylon rubiginosum]